jgi:exonuclease SbcC
MIKSLDITNFESHKETHLDFHSGVNIVIGDTDAGKSAIINSLRWVKDNRPSGSDFRSRWGGITSVKITVEEGSVIRKKDKVDEYIRKFTGKKPLSLKAFRSDVPEEISDLLNLNDINLQQQLDRHFLLSKTPGEVAIYFNKIAHYDKIDLGMSNVQKRIREISQDIKYKKQDRIKFTKQLEKYSYLDKLEVDMEVLEEMEKKFVRMCNNKTKLRGLLETYYDNRIQLSMHEFTLNLEPLVTKILKLYKEKEETVSKWKKLDDLVADYCNLNDEIKENKKLTKLEKPVEHLLQLHKEREVLESKRKSLNSLVTNYKHITVGIKRSEVNHKALCVKYNKEFPDVCLLCGQPVPHDHDLIF